MNAYNLTQSLAEKEQKSWDFMDRGTYDEDFGYDEGTNKLEVNSNEIATYTDMGAFDGEFLNEKKEKFNRSYLGQFIRFFKRETIESEVVAHVGLVTLVAMSASATFGAVSVITAICHTVSNLF